MEPITGGVLIPVCSPCDDEGRFLPAEFEKLMEQGMSEPLIDGAYVCGGTGEGLLMRVEERQEACEIAVTVARKHGKAILAHVGATAMRDALELARHAAKAGVSAISTVPQSDVDLVGQINYYRTVTDAAGLPTVLYYVPGCQMPLEQVLQTLDVPGVIGIKSSSNDFFFTMQLMAGKPKESLLFNGKDEYLAAAVLQGAGGGIGMWANVFPRAYAGIYYMVKKGKLAEAFALQVKLNTLCCIAFRRGLLESFESILRYMGRWDRVFRRPSPRFDKVFYDAFVAEAKPLLEELLHPAIL